MTMMLFDPPAELCRITPRDYQERAIESTIASWIAGDAGALVRLPTGCGKTIVGSLIADHWLQRDDNNRVIVIAHERQLIWQFAQEIEDVLGLKPDIEMASHRASGEELITVASRATLRIEHPGDPCVECGGTGQVGDDEEPAKCKPCKGKGRVAPPPAEIIHDERSQSRLFKFRPEFNWLVILDEAHRYSFGLVSCAQIMLWFEKCGGGHRVALTATPERMDGASLEKIAPCVASDYRLYAADEPCAVEDGWAVPYEQHYVVVEGVDFKNLEEVAGDFRDDELDEVLGTQEQLAKLIEPTLELVEDRLTLIFSPSVRMARNVAEYINAKLGWDAAASLDGGVPEISRRETYKRFEDGDFQFLSVCGLCREGYNNPSIGAVAVFRPTKSRPLAEQMKGRGCRPLRGLLNSDDDRETRLRKIAESSKPNCLIVDLVGVTGIADCASTVELYTEGEEDEVTQLATAAVVAGEKDVRKAIQEAREQIAEKREQARIAREQRELAARAEAERRAKIQAETKYTAHQVGRGEGGVGTNVDSKGRELATRKQLNYLRWKKIEHDPETCTKAQASRMIGQDKKGLSPEKIAATNRPIKRESAKVEDVNRMLWEAAESGSVYE